MVIVSETPDGHQGAPLNSLGSEQLPALPVLLSASPSVSFFFLRQADFPVVLLAHLPAGDRELRGHDVCHQPRVLLRQHCPPHGAAALPALQIAHQQLGLH